MSTPFIPRPVGILYVSGFGHLGGGEISLLTSLGALDRERFRPFVICLQSGPFIGRLRELGIEPLIIKRDSLASNFRIIEEMIHFMRINNIHLVHVNSLDIRAGIACWMAGIPCIGHLRVIYPFSWRDRLFVRLSAKTVAVSEAVIRDFCRGTRRYEEKFVIIPNAVSIPDPLIPYSLKGEFALPPESRCVGLVGRIEPLKGLEYYLGAAARMLKRHPECVFFIIGRKHPARREDRRYLRRIRRRIRKLGLSRKVIFTDFRRNILEIIAGLDLVLVSSALIKRGKHRISEGFGRVAVEAMACGTPVAAFRVGGLEEIIEHDASGILVPAADAQAMAEAAGEILDDTEKRTRLIDGGRRRYLKEYTPALQVARLQRLYLDTLGGVVSLSDPPAA